MKFYIIQLFPFSNEKVSSTFVPVFVKLKLSKSILEILLEKRKQIVSGKLLKKHKVSGLNPD